MLERGHSGNGCDLAWTLCECDLASSLCKCDWRKGDLFVLSWAKGATSEAGKYLFRAANV